MSFRYVENPLVFLNSICASAPNGRNVRAQSRTQKASQLAPANKQAGQFGSFHVDLKRHGGAGERKNTRKRRKRANDTDHADIDSLCQSRSNQSHTTSMVHTVPQASTPTAIYPPLKPSEILAFATFHIRRIAAMTIQAHPDRLTQVLRCRQWSCVPVALERFGKSTCLDSALFCVAAKLQQMTGYSISSIQVLSSYETALQKLQLALQTPEKHDHVDLLTTLQLLAVYEMLESLESSSWTRHIAGVEILTRPEGTHRSKGLPFALTAPMFADALLTGNDKFFESRPWQTWLYTAGDGYSLLPRASLALMSCFFDLPMLIADVKGAGNGSASLDNSTKYALLDRAHLLKARIRSALLTGEQNADNDNELVGSFDKLGLCLAGLLALDRIVAALRPADPRARELAEDKTEQLCAQMLQLELGAEEAYAASDLMSAFAVSTFQEQAGFVIVLPGRGDG